MSQEAFATVAGYVTADPKLHRTTRTGTAVTHIRLACTPRRVDRESGEWRDAPTSYFTVTCWRKLAIAVAASVHKGDPVIVRGRFRTRTWSDAERMRTEVEIEADAMGHDLTSGWAHFMRERPQSPDSAADDSGGEALRQLVEATDADDRAQEMDDEYAERSTDGPDDDDAGSAAGDDPSAPIAPTEGSTGSDIFTEQPMVELDQELDEATTYPTPA